MSLSSFSDLAFTVNVRSPISGFVNCDISLISALMRGWLFTAIRETVGLDIIGTLSGFSSMIALIESLANVDWRRSVAHKYKGPPIIRRRLPPVFSEQFELGLPQSRRLI
jgi:hypothetical protein